MAEVRQAHLVGLAGKDKEEGREGAGFSAFGFFQAMAGMKDGKGIKQGGIPRYSKRCTIKSKQITDASFCMGVGRLWLDSLELIVFDVGVLLDTIAAFLFFLDKLFSRTT